MYLVGTDGGLLDKPYPVTELLLSPGERVDLLVKADQASGVVQVPVAARTAEGHDDAAQQVTLMTLTYRRRQGQTSPLPGPSSTRRHARCAG